MDQQKIGRFLRDLRTEREQTQEQLAEVLGVSNRSISRWENGVNMPDFDLLMQIARYFDVGVEEILDGERKLRSADPESEEALQKVAEYGNVEKLAYSRRVRVLLFVALFAIAVCVAIDMLELRDVGIYAYIADFMLGLVFGMILMALLYTSKFMAKCREFKLRLIKRAK